MTNGAIGLRDRRKAETVVRLSRAARQLTADGGLHGFTVEDVCEQADVSRRTFFNYFASKEDAVIGVPSWLDDSTLDERFRNGAQPGAGGGRLSPSLVDDYAALVIARWELTGLTPQDTQALAAAIEREPRLLSHLFEQSRRRERDDIQLLSQREGLAPDDLRATTLVSLLGAISRTAAEEFLGGTGHGAFADIFSRRLRAARELFQPSISNGES